MDYHNCSSSNTVILTGTNRCGGISRFSALGEQAGCNPTLRRTLRTLNRQLKVHTYYLDKILSKYRKFIAEGIANVFQTNLLNYLFIILCIFM